MGSRTRGTRTACRCPIKALSVQDGGGALSWELLGARSSHFGLALTSTRPRTPRSIARRPSAAARQALPSDAPPGVSWRLRPAGLPCSSSCSVRLAVVLAPKAEAVGFLPQTSPWATCLPWPLDSGAAGSPQAPGQSWLQRPTQPAPSGPGYLEPLPAPCLALNDPMAQAPATGQVSACSPRP